MFPRSVLGFHPLVMVTVAHAVKESVSELARSKIDWEDVRKKYSAIVARRLGALETDYDGTQIDPKKATAAKNMLLSMLPKRLNVFQCKSLWRAAAYSIVPRINACGPFPTADIVPGDIFKSVPLFPPEDQNINDADADDEGGSDSSDTDETTEDEDDNAALSSRRGGMSTGANKKPPVPQGTRTPVLHNSLTLEDMRALSLHAPRTLVFKRGVVQLPESLRKVASNPACWTKDSQAAKSRIDYKLLGTPTVQLPLPLAPDDQEISDIDMDTANTPGFEDCNMKYVTEQVIPRLSDPSKSLSDLFEIDYQHSKWPPTAFAVQAAATDYVMGDVPYRVIAPLNVPVPIPNPAHVSRRLPLPPTDEKELRYQGQTLPNPLASAPCTVTHSMHELGIAGATVKNAEALRSLATLVAPRMRSHKARDKEEAPLPFLAQVMHATQPDQPPCPPRVKLPGEENDKLDYVLPMGVTPGGSQLRAKTAELLVKPENLKELGTCSTQQFGPLTLVGEHALTGSSGHIIDTLDESARTLGHSLRTSTIFISGTAQHLYDDKFVSKVLEISRKGDSRLFHAVVTQPLVEFNQREPPASCQLTKVPEAAKVHPVLAKRLESLIKSSTSPSSTSSDVGLGAKRCRDEALGSPAVENHTKHVELAHSDK